MTSLTPHHPIFNTQPHHPRKRRRWLLYIFIAFLAIAIFCVIEFIQIINNLPHPEKITSFQPTQSTKIYDRTGTVLLYEIHGDQNRTLVDANTLPPYVKQATLAVEDQQFYQHSALDWKSLIRSLITDVIHGQFIQGGSTITQQLVKNVFLSPEKTITRKIKELVLAYWIEQEYSKDQILNFYINQINYGSNSYGIQSASTRFFGKNAVDLTIAQSATLAALIQAPSYYSPWGSHVSDLMDRKNFVLEQMSKLGFITDQELQEALHEKITFLPENIGVIKAPHFSMMVRDYLINTYGQDVVDHGGLKVITTLDWNTQQLAEKAITEGVQRDTQLYGGKNGALVAEDPTTGQILALVGSADYFNTAIDGNFNVATQGLRQPGSSFKPFVYLTAFEKGYTPDTILFNVETNFNTTGNPKYDYTPQNFEGTFTGPMSLKEALAQSVNVPAVKLLYLVGIQNAIATAQKFGITTLTDPSRYGLSLVLGGGEVTLAQMVQAYSAFAQDGTLHPQSFILHIEDSTGKTYENYTDHPQKVIDPQYVRMLNQILSSADLRQPLFQASLALTKFDGYQVALKTGTTNDYRDAWTIGYTPFITVGVWAGNSDNTPMKQQGSSLLAALPMWSAFMKSIINTYPPASFPSPNPVSSSIPMLNGQDIFYAGADGKSCPQIHTILYYINKNNPQQQLPFPPPPSSDPQFNNWEQPVLNWARQNIPNFTQSYNQNCATTNTVTSTPALAPQ